MAMPDLWAMGHRLWLPFFAFAVLDVLVWLLGDLLSQVPDAGIGAALVAGAAPAVIYMFAAGTFALRANRLYWKRRTGTVDQAALPSVSAYRGRERIWAIVGVTVLIAAPALRMTLALLDSAPIGYLIFLAIGVAPKFVVVAGFCLWDWRQLRQQR
jgi:hypothetical protein